MIKKLTGSCLLLLLGCWIILQPAMGQNTFSSEEDLKKKAGQLFEDEEYAQAYPLYSQLLSIYPKDPNYNYRFGVCMLFATDNKEKSLPYLETASRSPKVEQEVFFFLGKAYHLNYRFDNAIKAYNQFKKTGSKSAINKYKPDREIEACNSGKSLLKSIKDLTVIDKKEVNSADFFRVYDLNGMRGKLLVKPDDFKTPFDTKKNEKSVIFLATGSDKIYYSSYGVDGKQGKDIYVVSRLPDGEWSTPQNLGSSINTPYDEDFPFMHPNGKSLYFCSKGHNSMGGYDVFKSNYDETSNSWSAPVNLDFPVNTPDDEIMYVTDSLDRVACFASARNSSSGMIAVFKTQTDRKPIDAAVINGKFVKAPTQKDYKSKIVVKNLDTEEQEGTFYSNLTTGDYLLQLTNGGKFLFTVESEGYNSQSEVIQISKQQSFKPITQYISYNPEGKLTITTNFTELPSDTGYLAAMLFIKDKARLEVNYNEATDHQPQTTTPPKVEDTPVTEGGTAKQDATALSGNDLVKMAYNDAKDAESDAKELRVQANNAFAIVNEKNNLAQAKQKEADDARSAANGIADPAQKQAALDKAGAIQTEADRLARETVTSYNFAKRLDVNATAKEEEANLSLRYAQQLDNVDKAKNPEEALKQLEQLKQQMDQLSNTQQTGDDPYKSLKADADRKQKEADESVMRSEGLKKDIENSKIEAQKMREDATKERKEEVKESMLQMAGEIDEDIVTMQKQLEENDAKTVKLQREAAALKADAELVNGVMAQLKISTGAAPDMDAEDKQKLEKTVAIYQNDAQYANANASATNPAVTENTSKSESSNPSTSPATDQPAISVVETNPTPSATTSSSASPAVPAITVVSDNATSINEKYTKALAEAENKPTDYERQQEKAAVYKSWSEELEADIKLKKEELEKITDTEQRTLAEQKIKNQEQQITEKQQLTTTATAEAERVKSSSASVSPSVTATTSPEATSSVTTNPGVTVKESVQPVQLTDTAGASIAKYSAQLESIDKQASGTAGDQQKAQVYKNWKTDLVNEIEKRRAGLATISDDKQKEQEIQKIRELTALAQEKQKLAEDAEARVAQSPATSDSPVAATGAGATADTPDSGKNNATSPAESPGVVTSPGSVPGNAAPAIATTPVNTTGNSVGTSAPVTRSAPVVIDASTTSTQLEEKALSADKEAAGLRQQAQAIRTEAGNKATPEERDVEIKKAVALEEQAAKKDGEVVELYALSKQVEFMRNDDALDQLAKLSEKKEGEDLPRAGLLKEEAAIYYNKAKEDRKNAAEATDPDVKQELLQKAADKEQLAIQRQATAREIYMKYNPEYVYQPGAITLQPGGAPANSSSSGTTGNALVNTSTNPNPVGTTTPDKQVENNNTLAQPVTTNLQPSSSVPSVTSPAVDNQPATVATNPAGSTPPPSSLVPSTTSPAVDNQLATVATNPAGSTQQPSSPVTSTEIDAGKLESIKNLPEYKDYVRIVGEARSEEENAKQDYEVSDNMRKKATEEQNMAVKTREEALLETDNSKKEELNKKADAYDSNARAYLASSDSALALAKNSETTANSKKREAELLVQTMNSSVTETPEEKTKAQKLSQAANLPSQYFEDKPTKPATSTSISAAKGDNAFSISGTTAYSDANPIPIDPALPDGLIFKVQVGAFKKPIPQDLFKGINPLAGERTPNGFLRYTAGLFTVFTTADEAKNKIKNIGYKDAFVVAFLNGKRIPMSEAMAMLQTGGAGISTSATGSAEAPTVSRQPETPTSANPAVSTLTSGSNLAGGTNNNNGVIPTGTTLPVTTDLGGISGALYTVQIGVYSKPVTSAQLFNISPVYTEIMNNGLKRYTTGVYNKRATADKAKDVIVNVGVKDAFVVAFKDGKRLGLDEAAKIETQGAGMVTDNNVTGLPSVNQNSVVTPVALPTTSPSVPATATIIYKVQIGAFRSEVPINVANSFLKISNKGIAVVTENGLTVYTVGAFNDYQTALNLKKEIAGEIPDAFVVAYSNGKKITLEEAKALEKK